jgi:hypothetical protein
LAGVVSSCTSGVSRCATTWTVTRSPALSASSVTTAGLPCDHSQELGVGVDRERPVAALADQLLQRPPVPGLDRDRQRGGAGGRVDLKTAGEGEIDRARPVGGHRSPGHESD